VIEVVEKSSRKRARKTEDTEQRTAAPVCKLLFFTVTHFLFHMLSLINF